MGRNLFRRETLVLLLLLSVLPSVRAESPPGDVQARGPNHSQEGKLLSPTALPARQGHMAAPLYSLEITNSALIQEKIEHRLKWGKRGLEASLKRAHIYRRFICSRIDALNLPRELLFLPILESEYRRLAVSRSGAVGLWQFMKSTALPLGLRIDDWVDERQDFWKSTEAALLKLKENRAYFGDWLLALAAYNCGTGKLSRIIKSSGVRDFWRLKELGLLPQESADYVPKFLSLAAICSYPAKYGLDITWEESLHWERVKLERSIELELLCRAVGLPADILIMGNAELKQPVSPVYKEGYWLKVPLNYRERVIQALADPELKLINFSFHKIRYGDTLYGLARHYKVSLAMIEANNPGLKPRHLPLGMLIKIPLPGNEPVRPPAPPSSSPLPPASFRVDYTVQKGDTLWAISRIYNIAPEDLAAANRRGLEDILKPGETLKVPAKQRALKLKERRE